MRITRAGEIPNVAVWGDSAVDVAGIFACTMAE